MHFLISNAIFTYVDTCLMIHIQSYEQICRYFEGNLEFRIKHTRQVAKRYLFEQICNSVREPKYYNIPHFMTTRCGIQKAR